MAVFKLGRISNPGVQLKLMNLGLTQNQLVHGMSVMKIAQRLPKHLNGMRYEAYFPSWLQKSCSELFYYMLTDMLIQKGMY